MRFQLLFALLVLMCVLVSVAEAGCKGSRCHKRRKNEEIRQEDNDPMDKIEDIEAKKKEKPKSEEESEEEEEKKKVVEEAVQRLRRRDAEQILQRNREMANAKFQNKHSLPDKEKHNQAHHHHRRRHVTGYEHTHSQEVAQAEPVNEVKDANLMEHKSLQRLRRGWHFVEEPVKEHKEFAYKQMHNQKFKRTKKSKDGVHHPHDRLELGEANEQGERMIRQPISSHRRLRHVTGEEHTHSGEQVPDEQKNGGGKQRLKKHIQSHPRGHDDKDLTLFHDPHRARLNLERRRYPKFETGKPGRVLPLPSADEDVVPFWLAVKHDA